MRPSQLLLLTNDMFDHKSFFELLKENAVQFKTMVREDHIFYLQEIYSQISDMLSSFRVNH